MIKAGDSILVATSGGPDSVCLSYTLKMLSQKLSIKKIALAHLNHKLRGYKSDRDANFVLSLAKNFDMECYIKDENVLEYKKNNKLSLEEAGRKLRYNFFEEISNSYGYNKVAIGHNADDNSELVFMYLIRGSGLTGLSGIRPVRDDKIIRPLIKMQKSKILDFISKNKLSYVIDDSNNDKIYLRNKIRHELLPMIKTCYNPNIVETITRFTNIIRSEEEWIEKNIDNLFPNLISNKNKFTLYLPLFNNLDVALKRRVIRKAIEKVKGDLRRISFSHIDSVLYILNNGKESSSLNLPDDVYIFRKKDILFFSKKKEKDYVLKDDNLIRYEIINTGTIFIQEIKAILTFEIFEGNSNFLNLYNSPNTALFDMDKLSFPFFLRKAVHGDKFIPLGMSGNQKLKTYFINNKIPKSERWNSLVLLNKEKIIWLIGHRIENTKRLTPLTRNVLKVEIVYK